MTIFLELDANPNGTAQQTGHMVRGGKIHHYVKKNVLSQRQIYRNAILEELNGIDTPHYDGPVFLDVTFYFAIKDKKRWGQWKTSRADCDNLVKLLQDAMSDIGFWDDDAQIANLHVRKKFESKPGILIEVGRLIQP